MKVGQLVIGKVTGIKSYGAFVLLEEGSGLVHISEFSNNYVPDIHDLVKIGEELLLEVIDYDIEHERFKLSFKKCNIKPSKAHRLIKVTKGYNSLGVNLEKWKQEALDKYKEE